MLAAGLSCGRDRDEIDFPAGTPIIIVSVDTLRSDRLPFYGYAAVETPALTRLRNDSILFRHAYSHIPLTLPAHASVFTGLLPPEHGIRDNSGYILDTPGCSVSAQDPQAAGLCHRRRGLLLGPTGSRRVWMRDFDFYEDLIEDPAPGIGPGGAQRPGGHTLTAIDRVAPIGR